MKELHQLELWRQDESDPNLWHGAKGLLVNTAALAEREAYFEVVRVPARLPEEKTRQNVDIYGSRLGVG